MSEHWYRTLKTFATNVWAHRKDYIQDRSENLVIPFSHADLEGAPVAQITAWDLYAASFLFGRFVWRAIVKQSPNTSSEEALINEAGIFANKMMIARADFFNSWIKRKVGVKKEDKE